MRRSFVTTCSAMLGIATIATAQPNFNEDDYSFVTMETGLGSFTLVLDKLNAPITVDNFLSYVESGFYEGTIFHRIIPTFMVQGGGFDVNLEQKETNDPIENEWMNGLSNRLGTIAMARTSQPNTATSQFFISVKDNSSSLDSVNGGPGYAVFGQVIDGMDVIEEIKNVETDTSKLHPRESSTPVNPPMITSVSIIDADDLSDTALEGLESYITDAVAWQSERKASIELVRKAMEEAERREELSRQAFAKAVELLSDAEAMDNGLTIADAETGNGDTPESAASSVTVHYRGWLIDGTEFDASYNSPTGDPLTFSLNGVIQGWGQGLLDMREGGTRYLRIPPQLAYGPNGSGPIPPNATLIFEVTLLDAISEAEKRAPFLAALKTIEEQGEQLDGGLVVATELIGKPDAQASQVCQPDSTVSMHFTLWLDDGTEVFDSRRNNAPEEGIRRQIRTLEFPGIEQGMIGMVPGEIRVMQIPSELGLSPQRRGPNIPADAGFVVRMEAVDITTPLQAPDAEAAPAGSSPSGQ